MMVHIDKFLTLFAIVCLVLLQESTGDSVQYSNMVPSLASQRLRSYGVKDTRKLLAAAIISDSDSNSRRFLKKKKKKGFWNKVGKDMKKAADATGKWFSKTGKTISHETDVALHILVADSTDGLDPKTQKLIWSWVENNEGLLVSIAVGVTLTVLTEGAAAGWFASSPGDFDLMYMAGGNMITPDSAAAAAETAVDLMDGMAPAPDLMDGVDLAEFSSNDLINQIGGTIVYGGRNAYTVLEGVQQAWTTEDGLVESEVLTLRVIQTSDQSTTGILTVSDDFIVNGQTVKVQCRVWSAENGAESSFFSDVTENELKVFVGLLNDSGEVTNWMTYNDASEYFQLTLNKSLAQVTREKKIVQVTLDGLHLVKFPSS